MDDFGIYVVLGINEAPQRLLSVNGSSKTFLAVPPSARQVVVFSSGQWGERICVNAELNDANRFPITIGKLTPYNKCLSWEQWEEEGWEEGVTLSVTLEGGNLVRCDMEGAELMLATMEHTPKFPVAPPAGRETTSHKRKRDPPQDSDPTKPDQENVSPNGVSTKDETTPSRKVRGHAKGHRLLGSGAVGEKQHVPKITGGRGRGRAAKTPAQTAPLVSPSGRWGQSLCLIDPQTAILIGGQGSRMQFCKDPMWKLCTEDMSWVTAETLAEGPTPEARIGHTATFDPDSRKIFVFGGSKNKKWFNDVHILDTLSWKWSMVEAQGKVPPLAYHSCNLFRGELFVLGGVFPRPSPQPDGCSDSLYIFDPRLSIWYQPIVMGDKPSPRSGHSACVLHGRIYVFGGWDTPVCFNDMYVLDLGLMEFSAVPTTGKPPSPRSWHGSVVLSETKFLIHGGYNGNKALNDTFIFDTDTNTWTEVTHPQLSAPRAGHSLVTVATEKPPALWLEEDVRRVTAASLLDRTTLLMFGGGDNEGHFFSDLTTITIDELVNQL